MAEEICEVCDNLDRPLFSSGYGDFKLPLVNNADVAATPGKTLSRSGKYTDSSVVIDRFTLGDLAAAAPVFSDISQMQLYLPDEDRTYKYEELTSLFHSWHDGRECFVFAVRSKDHTCGIMTAEDLNRCNKSLELGIIVFPAYRRQGIAEIAMRTMLTHIFAVLAFNRVQVRVFAENRASLQLMHKLGFVTEGTLRQYGVKNGRTLDLIVMSMLQSEWQALQRTETQLNF